MSVFSETLFRMQSSDPDWLFNSYEFNVSALQVLNYQILRHTCSRLGLQVALLDVELFHLSPDIPSKSRHAFVTSYYNSVFGTEVAFALHFLSIDFPVLPHVIPPDNLHSFLWLALDCSLYVNCFARVLSVSLKSCLSCFHPDHITTYKSSSNKSCALTLLQHIWCHCTWLCTCNDRDFAVYLFACLPTTELIPDVSCTDYIFTILNTVWQ